MDDETGTARRSCPTTSSPWPSARRARTPARRALTGWRIDIKSETQAEDDARPDRAPAETARSAAGAGGGGQAPSPEASAGSAPEEVVEAADVVVSEAGAAPD